MERARNYIQSVFLVIIVLVFVLVGTIARLYTDYLWFDALDFSDIFMISLKAKIAIFFAAALFFMAFSCVNMFIASRLHKSKWSMKASVLVAAAVSLVVGLASTGAWMKALQYFNQVPFGLADPILGKDAAFYVFSLPFLNSVWGYLLATVILTTILVAVYYLRQIIVAALSSRRVDPNTNAVISSANWKQEFAKLRKSAMAHMAVLGSFIFVLLAVRHYLARFSVMYSEQGIVVGAGYTDVYVFLPVVKLLMVTAIIVAVLFYVWIFYFSTEARLKKRHIILFVIIVYLLFAFVGKTLVPGIVQALKVSPNELNLERPFIENNINFTRIAYGLDEVDEEDFAAVQNMTPETLARADETIKNVRILDWRPLTQTYKQTQEIRLYYDLSGIDIDRYVLNSSYTQVMLSPRELDQSQIAQNAKTWVNLHMVYTHGFGLVMSPVNRVTKQGLPDYLIQDIPPVNNAGDSVLDVSQPRIYYGEKDNDFVLVNTNTDEFDYPKGNSNEYISYDGKGGVVLDTFFKKLMMAVRFKDIKILLSSDMTPQSKVLFDRNIQDRISKLTPFLKLDYDPYLVIDQGRLYWIQDAYTVTGNFPYSAKLGGINYIRNAVKVVVDAYDGDVTYYVMDDKDPLMQTYVNIFPNQFKLFESMPSGLKKHIRYPEDLFKAQSFIYSTYHMDDVTVFYNKEDAWQIPNEIYGTGEQVKVEPYYIIMKLPGETKEEFVLMTSFTPIKKDNMVSWLAARSDNSEYGKLLLYKFPKDKLVYGPMQVEAKIDQDSLISQQITLWSQQGSRVTRGNLLVIPIDNSILYIEPLYLQAEKGQLPELKRVIVSDGDDVVMAEDLGSALEALFGKAKTAAEEGAGTGAAAQTAGKSQKQLIAQANSDYEDILSAMKSGDWSSFGQSFDSLGDVLEALAED